MNSTWQMIEWFRSGDKTDGVWSVFGDYGSFHMYAVFMTLGVVAAISISAVKLWRKKISLTGLYIGAIPIVIVSLFGASYFGKMPMGESFWNCFAFWHGGMSIHGGVLVGALSGMLIFYIIGRSTRVSVLTYMDAIIPNILIGQAIGRWGNFFNHELVGQPVSLASDHNILSWMPKFILNNTQFQYYGPDGYNYKGLILHSGQLYQMTPIFIIESFMLATSWILITFVIPGIGRWISKKPWKIDSETFKVDVKLTFKKPLYTKKTNNGYAYWEVWNNAFYQNVDQNAISQYLIDLDKLNKTSIGENWSYTKYKYNAGKLLLVANNPNKYRIPYCGIEAGAYFFLWNIVRFSLESIRPTDVLFISYHRTLSLVLVGLASLIGIIIILLSIFVFPFFMREEDFVFEKNYFLINSNNRTNVYKRSEYKTLKLK